MWRNHDTVAVDWATTTKLESHQDCDSMKETMTGEGSQFNNFANTEPHWSFACDCQTQIMNLPGEGIIPNSILSSMAAKPTKQRNHWNLN